MVLNTIVAESLDAICDKLEAMEGDFNVNLQNLLQRLIRKHKRVLFSGDGYSGAWKDEAAKRGLPDLPDTIAAIGPLVEKDESRYAPLKSWLLSERAYMKCMEGRFEESIPDLEEALTLLESNIIRSAPGCAAQEAVLHASIGGMYRAVGQNEKALEDTSEAIDIAEAILTSNTSATNRPSTLQPFIDFLAGCHYRRGEILRDLGRRQEAVESYDRARGLWKSLGGKFRVTYCQALSRLGSRYYAMEQIDKASECGAEIVEILKPLAERDPSAFGQQYLIALRNYALTLGNQGNLAAAEEVEAESAAFKEKFGFK